jgi:hypothetical protein
VKQGVGLGLEFSDDVSPRVRARMSYAFRVFAAIYGHPVEAERRPDAFLCVYGGRDDADSAQCIHIPARYVLRAPEQPLPPPASCLYGGERLHLFHGREESSGHPDWLAEIFEWLSSADEMSVAGRDSLGRIASEPTIFRDPAISRQRPHASLMMAWLENAISNRITQGRAEQLPAAPSPVPGADHLVICSHDVDFYFAGRWPSLVRVLKNLGIALLVTRSSAFFRDSLGQLWRLLCGERVGDWLPPLLRASREQAFSSTYFVIAGHEHRRDGNYSLAQIAPRLDMARQEGSEVGLHGSYRSVVENLDLASEADALAEGTGHRPRGSRQHWLRFDHHDKLFASVEEAGLLYDSSLGSSRHVGFRNGAAFAFPPYNFEREQAYPFLTIPLVVMDVALEADEGKTEPAELAAQVLSESRRWGWGAVSLLWHNPVEPLSVSRRSNGFFWEQMKLRRERNELWISAEEFLRLSLWRYQEAGLLHGGRWAEHSRVEACDPGSARWRETQVSSL